MIRVKRDNPCPICGRPDWCLVAEDGSAAICQRISEGSVKQVGDAGFLHILKDTPPDKRKHYVKPVKQCGTSVNWEKLTADYRQVFDVVKAVYTFALSAMALDDLQTGWCSAKKAHSFPMKDGKGNIIGLRLRTTTGNKFSVPGSRNGIFWPLCVKADADELLFVCEGPTDCGALLDMRLAPIGRASCGTGFIYIKEMIEHYERQVVIIADKDVAKYHPNGRKFYPGYDGAMRLARSIKSFVRSVRVIKPPEKKDIREWYQAGATRAMVLALVKNARFL
jgi:hypothetical protein